MKKLRGVFLIVFVVSALVFALVACSETAITEHSHQWSEWSVDTATCTEGGTQTRTCTREGCKAQDGKPATQTRTTAALGHNVTSWTLCEADHSKHEGVCSRPNCGVTVTEVHHANEAGTECVDCGEALGGSEQCLHPNASATSETAATCTSAKIEHWTCPDCVWTEDRPVGAALGHDEYKVDETAATCTANKVEHWACHRCDWTDDKEIAESALGHAWSEWTEDTATCTEGGTQTRTCERDGCDTGDGDPATETRTTDALGHDEYKVDETAATCTANKVEHWACHRCDWTDDKEIADTVLGHAWSEWTEDTATCTEGGTQTRTCERDGCDTGDGDPATETRTTDALGHDEYKVDETAATCTANKVEHWACHRCDWTDDKEIVDTVLGHAWSEWTEDTATCTEGGTQTRTCERDGCDTGDGDPATDSRTTDALGHDKYIANETAATCTANKVEHWACHRCNWTDDKEIADTVLGHDYTNVDWTAVAGGTHERECARGCGDKQTGTCDDDGVIAGTAATCTAAGCENGTKCSVCGGNETLGKEIAALGHSLSVASVTPATCTAAQVNHMECGRCGHTEDQTEGNALGHDFTGTTVVVVPDDATYHATKCSRCDALDINNKHAAEWGEYGLTADETQHYQVCKHCDIQSTPVDHSATIYTYASNGQHSGECACGKALTEKCELTDGSNACSVCGRIVGSVNGVGDFTIDFSTYGNANIEPMTDIKIDGVTISFAKGSASTNPRYWAADKGMRTYKGNSLTVTAPKGGKITSISFTGAFSSNSAGYNSSSKTWTGSGETVTLDITVNSNFTKIAITFDSVELCYHDNTVVACSQSAATCEGTGISQNCFRCESCNLYFTTQACTEILENAVVDALGHNYGEWIDEVAPTCAAAGTKGHYHCDACGKNFDSEKAVLEDLTIAINAGNHSHLSAVAKQDATCGEAGWNAHYACDGCGKKYETEDATEEYDPAVAALGHDLQYRANGTDKHEQYCTRCDYVGEAAEHTATTWVAATNGHHKVCTVCGLKFNEEEHTYTDGTCVCGMKDTHKHNYTGTVTKEPTCTEKGVTTYACDGCDDTYTEDIDALGHNFTGDVLPIVGDETYHATKCSRCDAFDVANKHAAEWGDYALTEDETQHYQICKHCDVQSTPVGHSATYIYASNGEHSGECACGKVLTEACTPAGDNNACTGCGRIIFIQNSSGSNELVPPATSTSSSGNVVTYISGSVTFVLTENNSTKGGFGNPELRFYSGNTLAISVPNGYVATVVLTGADTSRKAQGNITINSPASATTAFSDNGLTMTITNSDTAVREIEIKATAQVRLTSITVTYSGSVVCYHDNTVVACSQSAATCEGAGISQDCYRCENCNLYFTTDACTEILENAVVDALGHNYGEWIDEVAPTCAATGTKGHFHCGACDTDFDSEKAVLDDLTIAIDPNNHVGDLNHVEAKAPTTCDITDTEHAGHVEYWQCACGVMYADANRSTVIDSLEPIYLGHTPDWTTKTDSGHSGKCSVCNADIAEQQHVWNEANTACTICGYEKPAGKHYITTVIIVDGVQVAGIPAGVTLTWEPADANGAFDEGADASLEISLSGYNLVSVVVTDSAGNESDDWLVEDGYCVGKMNGDYMLTITIVSIPTAVVNYSVDNATVTVTADGTAINSGDRVLVGTELTITVTANEGYTVTGVTVNGTAVANGKYTVAETDTTITIAATVEEVSEKTTTYQFGSADTGASNTISNANLKSKFASALQSGDTDVISSVSATNVFSTTANADNLKFGSAKNLGSLTITFNSNVKVTKIVITAKTYGSDSSQINIDGNNSETLGSTAEEFEFEINSNGSVKINVTGKRGYIDSIVIYYEEV